MQKRTCYFSGHVQGVGFRYTAREAALGHAVTGYVRNLADGRVEMVIEGEPGDIDVVLEDLGRRMEGFIRKTQVREDQATGEFADFSVRH